MDKYTATEQAYKNGYEKGYAAGKPKWIPVSERLPDKNNYVLVFTYDGIVGEAKRDEDGLFYWAGADFWANALKVAHWMPLPEPPREV
jgi:hypothetical protein